MVLINRGVAAKIIGCDVNTVTNAANRGQLRVVERTSSGRRKYDENEVRAFASMWRAKFYPKES
jgi:predicted site-specific integrase-resolvase